MVADEYVPDRGDIVWLNFSPQAGHEQAGRRPAFVVSAKEFNESNRLAIFCPITSKSKINPFEVVLPASGPITGTVLVDHIKSLDWRARLARFVMRAKPRTLTDVLGKLGALLFSSLLRRYETRSRSSQQFDLFNTH